MRARSLLLILLLFSNLSYAACDESAITPTSKDTVLTISARIRCLILERNEALRDLQSESARNAELQSANQIVNNALTTAKAQIEGLTKRKPAPVIAVQRLAPPDGLLARFGWTAERACKDTALRLFKSFGLTGLHQSIFAVEANIENIAVGVACWSPTYPETVIIVTGPTEDAQKVHDLLGSLSHGFLRE